MNSFQILCRIAWRNLWRNTRRTLLTAATISGGLALLLVFFGLGDGLHQQMLHNAVHLGGAHVAVQARGYQARRAIELTLAGEIPEELAASLAGSGAPATVIPRLYASGLASSSDGSAGVSIIGIDPAREAPVSVLDEKLVTGDFFAQASEDVAVIGKGVARKLELSPGSKFVLMAQGPGSPEIQSLLIRVAGVIESGAEEIDEAAVLVPLATAQELLGLPGRIHQAAVILDGPNQTERVAQVLRATVAPGAEVLRWDELMPSLSDFIRNDVAGLFIIDTIFFLIISFLVANTLLVSVLERRREFALLDAVGLTPTRRFLMIMLEATWIGILSILTGTAAGWLGHGYLHRRGLNLAMFTDSGWSAAGTAVDPVLHSALSVSRSLVAVALVFLLTLALALLPAWKAATGGDAHTLGQA